MSTTLYNEYHKKKLSTYRIFLYATISFISNLPYSLQTTFYNNIGIQFHHILLKKNYLTIIIIFKFT